MDEDIDKKYGLDFEKYTTDQILEKYKDTEFYKSLYNICLDSMYLSFAILIALLMYSAIKDVLEKFEDKKKIIKYILTIALFGGYIGGTYILNKKKVIKCLN